jgi:hypothetical protein
MPEIRPQDRNFDPLGGRRENGDVALGLELASEFRIDLPRPGHLEPFAGRKRREGSDDGHDAAAVDREFEDRIAVLGIEEKDRFDRPFELFGHCFYLM